LSYKNCAKLLCILKNRFHTNDIYSNQIILANYFHFKNNNLWFLRTKVRTSSESYCSVLERRHQGPAHQYIRVPGWWSLVPVQPIGASAAGGNLHVGKGTANTRQAALACIQRLT